MSETFVCLVICTLVLPLALVAVRLIQVLPSHGPTKKNGRKRVNIKEAKANIAILLGSGGHTGEMIRILDTVDLSYLSRTWFISSGDNTSINKAKDFENRLESDCKAQFVQLHRARKVGEGFILSIINTVKSTLLTIPVLLQLPKITILLINGPGTSVPLAYILFIMKFLGLCKTKIIYIESLARVNKLSLSGKLILPIADRFIVQWEGLAHQYKRAEYHGILL